MFYVKNTLPSTSLTLSITATNWNPVTADGPLAITWKFRKRTFSLGTKFRTEIFNRYLSLDLTHISLSQTFSSQMTLDNQELKQTLPSFLKIDFEKIDLLGVLDKSKLKKLGGIPKEEWNFGINQDGVNTFFSSLKALIIRKKK